jgi:O-antigen ligase
MAAESRSAASAEEAASVPGLAYHRLIFGGLALLLLALPMVDLPEAGPWLGLKAFLLEIAGIILTVLVLSRGDWTASRVRAALGAPINLAILGFILWIGVSAATATVPRYARYDAMRHLGGVLVYVGALYGLSARRQLNKAVWLIAAVGSLSAIAAFLNAAEDDVQRISGAFHNQQLLAGFLCVLFPLTLVASQQEKEPWPKIGLQVAVVIIGAGILVTQNRSAWLGAGVGLVVVVCLYFLYGRDPGAGLQRAQVIMPLLIISLIVGLFVGMSRMSGSLSARAGTLSQLQRDDSFQWRLGMWSKALRMLRDRPLTGWGVGSYPLQQALYDHPAVKGRTQRQIAAGGAGLAENAHNTFLQLGAETGVPGLLLYLSVFVSFIATGLRALPRLRRGFRQGVLMGALGGAVAHLVSAFGSPAWEFPECSTFLWVILALGMVAAGLGDRGREPESARAASSPAM